MKLTKKTSIHCILLLFFLFPSMQLSAQVSYGGKPASFSIKGDDVILPTFDVKLKLSVKEMIDRDMENHQKKVMPPKVAEAIPLFINLSTQGKWSMLADNSYVCRLRVRAPGALAMFFSYSDFYIPKGASLYIYNKDRTHILGAYTEKTNSKGGVFATEMIAGDDAVFEYVSPSKELLPRIMIDEVGYCYNNLVMQNLSTRGTAESCMINVNCEEGRLWQNEKKGVALVYIYAGGDGWRQCSGTLINNTKQDNTPYFLSAFHCYEGCEEKDLDKSTFYFGYEAEDCAGYNRTEYYTATGSKLRVAIPLYKGSDGLLLELTEELPEEWDLYFNGWDRRDKVVTGLGVGIHHAAGDIKKISSFGDYSSSTWTWTDKNLYGADDGYWDVSFVETRNGLSVIQGGSSGSPMFTSEYAVAGSLSGSNISCAEPHGHAWYGKMYYHWDKYGFSPATQMKTWLDPLGTDALVLAGKPYVIDRPRIEIYRKNMVFYSTQINQPGDIQQLTLNTFMLSQPVKVTVEGDFALSLDGEVWDETITMPAHGGKFYVSYVPQTVGVHEGTITFSQPEIKDNTIIRLTASSCPQFEVDALPSGLIGQPYSADISVMGGREPYTFQLQSSKLPKGLNMTAEGKVNGTPLEEGFYNFLLSITDANGCSASINQTIYIGGNVVDVFPYEESFELSKQLPSNWTQQFVAGVAEWVIQDRTEEDITYPESAAIGNNNAYFYYKGLNDDRTTKLITPQLDLSEVTSPYLSFSLSQRFGFRAKDMLTLYYSSGIGSDWVELHKFSEDIRDWEKFEIELPNPSSEYFIAFEAQSASGNGVAIDDVRIYAKDDSGIYGSDSTNQLRLEYDAFVVDRLNVGWSASAQSIIIVNSSGEIIYNKTGLANEQAISIPTAGWSSGIYFIKVQCNDTTLISRFIKK